MLRLGESSPALVHWTSPFLLQCRDKALDGIWIVENASVVPSEVNRFELRRGEQPRDIVKTGIRRIIIPTDIQ